MEAGFGDGFNGFSLTMPREICDGLPHRLEICGKTLTSGSVLLGTVEVTLSPKFDGLDVEQVEEVKTRFVESSLIAALSRVDELEHSERLLIIERDSLREQLRLVGERLTRDLNAHTIAPSHTEIFKNLGNIVRTASITRRRDLWLDELSSLDLSGTILRGVFPHNGAAGQLAILVWGSGGIGDALYLSTVVRELFLLFRNCRIFLLHENRRAADLFARNPFVSGTIWLQQEQLGRFVQTVHAFDVFDLVAEVRYAVTYSTPPLSRIPRDFVHAASYRAAEWQKYVRYQWPNLNNLFANEVMARGLNKLGLVGMSSLLPIDASSEIDIFIPATDPTIASDLVGIPYITIHHGSDRKMAASGGVQTKNLPRTTWNLVTHKLQDAGFKVVQLGEEHEQPVHGIDVDLRGKTSLEMTAQIIKGAAVHVDTEGGLVHLARAVHTRSVVAFGPTPVVFFGYPQNDNIAPPVCGNCWWVNERWSTQCPRDFFIPECMKAHSAAILAERAISAAKRACELEISEAQLILKAATCAFVDRAVRAVAEPRKTGAILLGPNQDPTIIRELARPVGKVSFLLDGDRFEAVHDAFGDTSLITPYASGNIPRNTGSLDWVVAVGLDARDSRIFSLCRELARCVRPSGNLLIGFDLPDSGALEIFSTNLEAIRTQS